MKRRRRSAIAALATSLCVTGVLAIGASSASAQEGSVDFFAYLENGTETNLVGVPGAAAAAQCGPFPGLPSDDLFLFLIGINQNNGLAKSFTIENDAFSQFNPDTLAQERDDFDQNEVMPLNDLPGIGDEVSGRFEFANGSGSRNLTAQYSTEDGGNLGTLGSLGDCAVWGSAVKRFM
jgi:hypothetical protein